MKKMIFLNEPMMLFTMLALVIILAGCSSKGNTSQSAIDSSSNVIDSRQEESKNTESNSNKAFTDIEKETLLKQADILSEQIMMHSIRISSDPFAFFDGNYTTDKLSDSEIYKFLMSIFMFGEEHPYSELTHISNTGDTSGCSIVSFEDAQIIVNHFFGIENWQYNPNYPDYTEGKYQPLDYYDPVTGKYISQREVGGRNNNILLSNVSSNYNSSNTTILTNLTVTTGPGEEGTNIVKVCTIDIIFNIVHIDDNIYLQFNSITQIT